MRENEGTNTRQLRNSLKIPLTPELSLISTDFSHPAFELEIFIRHRFA